MALYQSGVSRAERSQGRDVEEGVRCLMGSEQGLHLAPEVALRCPAGFIEIGRAVHRGPLQSGPKQLLHTLPLVWRQVLVIAQSPLSAPAQLAPKPRPRHRP